MNQQQLVPAYGMPRLFPQKPYLGVPLCMLAIYSLMATQSQELLATANMVITPLVDGLHYIGLGVTKPFIDGPMPERYYINLVGIGVWGAVIYNLRSILWLAHYDGLLTVPDVGIRRVQETRDWSSRRAWVTVHIFLVATLLPMCGYSLASLLNSVHGWFVFHVKDSLTPILLIITFQIPGFFLAGLLAPLGVYLFHDSRLLLRKVSNL